MKNKNTRPKWLEGIDLQLLREHVVEDGGDGWTIWKPEYFTQMGFKADDLPTRDSQVGQWQVCHYQLGYGRGRRHDGSMEPRFHVPSGCGT